MKKLVFACLLWFSLAGIASPLLSFADGSYLGEGNWRCDNRGSGSYESHIKFSSDNTRADYAFNNGAISAELVFNFDSYGNFDVSQNGIVIGNGFCMSTQCRYAIVLNGFPLSEVFTFTNSHLYKLGTQVNAGNVSTYWEEDLWALPANY